MTPLYAHQEEGVRELVRLTDPDRGRVVPGCLMLAFEMRLGKTRTVIEAAQRLYAAGAIRQAIVVGPIAVLGVWADPLLGQIAEFSMVPVSTFTYRAKSRLWLAEPGARPRAESDEDSRPRLRWVVTNYEFMRQPGRLKHLVKSADRRTLLVVDESSNVSSPTSAQTRAVYALRRKCGRVVELNGTPEGDNPGDMYAQFKILDPAIIACQTWGEFKATYARVEKTSIYVKTPRGPQKREIEVITAWHDLDELGRRTSPYVLRRAASEVHDMPARLPAVTVTATLTRETWAVYRQMRADSVAWLSSNERCSAAQAAVKVLRLSQITSGFLGGVVTQEGDEHTTSDDVRWVGDEKLRAVLAWRAEQVRRDPAFRSVIWCRFRAEVERLAAAIRAAGGRAETLLGGQADADRARALALLDPRTAAAGPCDLVGTQRTGGLGLDMSAADTMLYSSCEYSRMARLQSEARILGPKQTRACAYFDVVAEGPSGERTVDHVVLRRLREKQDLAAMTSREWLRELQSI